MQKKISSVLTYLFFLGIGIFLIWWSLQQIPTDKWGDFKTSLQTANYWMVLPVFLILSLSHWVRALRWRILMQSMHYQPGLINIFFSVMIGYLANLAVPRLGEVLKCSLLAKYEKIPVEKLVGTIVAERAIDVISLGVVFLIALMAQFNIVGEYGIQLVHQVLDNSEGKVSWVKAGMFISILSLLIISIRIWFKQFSHLAIVAFSIKMLKGIWEGLSSVKKLKQKAWFIFYTVLIWGLYIFGTWIGLLTTIGTDTLGFSVAISALAFASIGMIITPGGIGAYAFFLAKVLEKNGIPFEIGFANGTLQWFAQFGIVLLVGGICVIVLPFYNKKISHESSNSHPR